MNRKGYMRTLEAFSAVVLTFIFMIYVIPQLQGNEIRRENLDIMGIALHDDDFRDCALMASIPLAENCTYNALAPLFPKTYNHSVEISETRQFNPSGLPQKRIFSESAMVAANISQYSPRYVRVYYWLK